MATVSFPPGSVVKDRSRLWRVDAQGQVIIVETKLSRDPERLAFTWQTQAGTQTTVTSHYCDLNPDPICARPDSRQATCSPDGSLRAFSSDRRWSS